MKTSQGDRPNTAVKVDLANSTAATEFYSYLAQAIAWSLIQGDTTRIQDSLRTFMPRMLQSTRPSTVREVCNERQLRLGSSVPQDISNFPDLKGGRLLVYFPDADLSDGAAQVETEGFFDVCNTPPWDTWVAYFEDYPPQNASYAAYLVAYVPPQFVDIADRGILVNPERCIAWLSDTDVWLAHQLRSVLLQ